MVYEGNLREAEGSQAHRDPFGCIVVCQAAVEEMPFVTHDKRAAEYAEPCVFAV